MNSQHAYSIIIRIKHHNTNLSILAFILHKISLRLKFTFPLIIDLFYSCPCFTSFKTLLLINNRVECAFMSEEKNLTQVTCPTRSYLTTLNFTVVEGKYEPRYKIDKKIKCCFRWNTLKTLWAVLVEFLYNSE